MLASSSGVLTSPGRTIDELCRGAGHASDPAVVIDDLKTTMTVDRLQTPREGGNVGKWPALVDAVLPGTIAKNEEPFPDLASCRRHILIRSVRMRGHFIFGIELRQCMLWVGVVMKGIGLRGGRGTEVGFFGATRAARRQ